jgi:hypothetical protein
LYDSHKYASVEEASTAVSNPMFLGGGGIYAEAAMDAAGAGAGVGVGPANEEEDAYVEADPNQPDIYDNDTSATAVIRRGNRASEMLQCARGDVPGGRPCTLTVDGGGPGRFCANHTCKQAGCCNTKSSTAAACDVHAPAGARPRAQTAWDATAASAGNAARGGRRGGAGVGAGAGGSSVHNNASTAIYNNDAYGNIPGSTTNNAAHAAGIHRGNRQQSTYAGFAEEEDC